MALHDWAREARSSDGPVTGENKRVTAAGIRAETRLFVGAGQDITGESPRGADARGRWYSGYAGAVLFTSAFADVDRRSTIDRLREYCQFAAGARNGKAYGVVPPHLLSRFARMDVPADTHAKQIGGGV